MKGKPLLTIPQLNKGTAFSETERHEFELLGKLPAYVETLEQQVKRAYLQYQAYADNLQKNIYLNNLHDKNQVLFYKLVSSYLTEILPVIYTPIVGTAVKEYSREFRQARGLYIAHTYRDEIDTILDNRSNPNIDLIVVTDGEGVLGIGDQGVGAMDIPIAKLMVYTLCAGINPLRTLPIMLDAGTNNQKLLDDPLYLGLRHKRIEGADYDDFIAKFVAAVKRKFPNVFLHWEDFGRHNAKRNLDLYRKEICSFNDDIEGTGIVTLAALLAAIKATGSSIKEQRIVMFGAGSASVGIADQISSAMQHEGLSAQEARRCFWLLDRSGLLIDDATSLTPHQRHYARPRTETADWQLSISPQVNLFDVVKNIKPTILIGCSTQGGAFNEVIVREMCAHVARPIIFPLSNPNENSEATPKDLFNWSDGKALVATGSPFPDIEHNGHTHRIAQCNNALAFPGLGLGILAVQATQVTDEMLWAACEAMFKHSPVLKDPRAPLLPSINEARQVTREIAIAVALQAKRENLVANTIKAEDIPALIDEQIWEPHYVPFKRV